MNPPTATFDVVVVGGGMVGATLACILGRAGLRTAILESRPPLREWEPGTADLRVSALTMTSQKILDTLGVWASILDYGVGPYRRMKVWDPGFGGELFFDGADVGYDCLGYIVENRVSVAALWEALDDLTEVSVICPAKVIELQEKAGAGRVVLDDGRCVAAQLIVAADGSESALRKMASIGVRGWSYDQLALVAMIETAEPHHQTAYQRFLAEGPLAFLPLANGCSSIVWTSTSATTQRYLALPETEFIEELYRASGGILGDLKLASSLASFPLKLQYAKNYSSDHVVLVGDSAHSVHPLAGQGANMGILDAAALAEVTIAAFKKGRSIATSGTLRKYQRWRKEDNLAMILAMDLLHRVYTLDLPGFGYLRSFGMNAINREVHLKNYFNRYAMGLRGDLPALANGKVCW